MSHAVAPLDQPRARHEPLLGVARTTSRRPWSFAALLVLIPTLAVLQADLASARQRVDHLVGQEAQARSAASRSRAQMKSVHAERATAAHRERVAQAELQRAQAQLAASGFTRSELTATVEATGEYLRGLDDARSSTRRRADQLARTVPTAERCISEGLRSLSNASTGWDRNETTDSTCRSLEPDPEESAPSAAP